MYTLINVVLIVLTALYFLFFIIIPFTYMVRSGHIRYKMYKMSGIIPTIYFDECCDKHVSQKERYLKYKELFDNYKNNEFK